MVRSHGFAKPHSHGSGLANCFLACRFISHGETIATCYRDTPQKRSSIYLLNRKHAGNEIASVDAARLYLRHGSSRDGPTCLRQRVWPLSTNSLCRCRSCHFSGHLFRWYLRRVWWRRDRADFCGSSGWNHHGSMARSGILKLWVYNNGMDRWIWCKTW
jgi:hypothetical protein